MRVVRARYEGGVLKPLEPLDLKEGEEVVLTLRRDLSRYVGALGRASYGELKEIEDGDR